MDTVRYGARDRFLTAQWLPPSLAEVRTRWISLGDVWSTQRMQSGHPDVPGTAVVITVIYTAEAAVSPAQKTPERTCTA